MTTQQADNVASTFATFIAEMNSTGMVSQIQSYVNTNAAQIQAVNSINPNTLLASANKLAPFTYAEAQYVADVFNANPSQAKQEILAANGVWNSLESAESEFQAIAAYISSVGGTLNVSGRQGQAHFQDVYCMPAVVGGLFALAAVFAPEVEIGIFLGATIYYGDLFAAGAAMFSISAGFGC